MQSLTRTFTGIVLPSLKLVRPPALIGCNSPLVAYRWLTWRVTGVDAPPSSSDTTIVIVNAPGPYVWLRPDTGEA